MALTPDLIKRLNKLDADCRFLWHGVTYSEDERTGRLRQVATEYVVCEITDRTISKAEFGRYANFHSKAYASARGVNEVEALSRALDIAERTRKPLTPAQRADLDSGRLVLGDEAAKRIAELEERLAAAEARASEGQAPKGKAK